MDKEQYDPRQARFELANALLAKITDLHGQVYQARSAEMSFAPNETVSPLDFDHLARALENVLTLAFELREENKQVV